MLSTEGPGRVDPRRRPAYHARSVSRAEDETRSAGRGVLLIGAAKILFIVGGYAVTLALPRIFEERVYGLFQVAFGAIAILNNVLIASTIQTVAKLVSESDERAGPALRQGLKIQAAVGATLALAVALGAPLLAEKVLLDPELTPLLRIASIVVLVYSLYAPLVGSLNGRRLFQRQAALDMSFTVLRTIGLIGGAAIGAGAIGAMGGFAGAAGAVLALGLIVVGVGRSGQGFPLKQWVAFMGLTWVYQFFLNGTLQIDLQVLKRTVTELAIESGQASDLARDAANVASAHYRAAQAFAFVPYQLILSVAFIVFPMVSRATSLGDQSAARRYVEGAMRFSLLVLLAIATPIAGAADGVMRVAYPPAYLAGSPALAILAFGMVAFALFVITATIVTGSGRPGIAASIAGLAFVLVVVLVRVLIGAMGVEHAGTAAAIGTSIGTTLAMIAVGAVVWRAHGAWIPLPSAIRGALAGGAGFAAAHYVPHGSALGAVAALASGVAAYAVALLVLRELGREDLAAALRIVSRKKS